MTMAMAMKTMMNLKKRWLNDDDDRLKPMWGVPFVIWQEGESAAISIFEKLGRARGAISNAIMMMIIIIEMVMMTMMKVIMMKVD